ncbi:MAG: biotin--[acetyl-CoA-carboxylase] ligase [Actinomycetota bacterium]|nr:biotin--[acetyl-CoA-carboxylase] ligase [Actinomycetota bacterium]
MSRLDADALVAGLGPWVPALEFYAETDSTNRVAFELADKGAAHGSLVVTEHQIAGRGRLGRRWFSPPGTCLLYSMILRPDLDPRHFPLVNLAAGVAICLAAEGAGVRLGLKWPNDVIAGSRKVAGILSEHRPGVIVLGAGINVNVERFPDEIGAVATSLSIEAGRFFDRVALLRSFLERFHEVYSTIPGGIPDLYRNWCETLGRRVRVELPSGTFEGVAADIDPSGALILSTGERVPAGDVIHLREAGVNLGVSNRMSEK